MRSGRRTVIAVASGKGGTGKTTLAAHLALAASIRAPTVLVDLDVEAPDASGYFPEALSAGKSEPVTVQVPFFKPEVCAGCGACMRACRFASIVAIGRTVAINETTCKGCGACVNVCPRGALGEKDVAAGQTSLSKAGGVLILEGRMAVGDIRSTAVIDKAKRRAAAMDPALEIRDCPPGTSCPATHAVSGSDVVILVAEPTEFSLHDLTGAIELVRSRGLASGVVINKDGFGSADIEEACSAAGIPVIGRIPYSRERAASGAAARLWTDDPSLVAVVDGILDAALALAEGAGLSSSGGVP